MSEKIHALLLEKAHCELPHIHRMICNNGVCKLEKKPSTALFPYLTRVIIGQQVSVAAAKSIWQKVEKLAVENNCDIYSCATKDHYDTLRACGLTGNKTKAIVGMRDAFEQGMISDQIHTTDDPQFIMDQIQQLWGLGKWSAEMALIFFFAHPDVWSYGDGALSKGLQALSRLENKDPENILTAFSPYRSYLALHVWRGIGSKQLPT